MVVGLRPAGSHASHLSMVRTSRSEVASFLREGSRAPHPHRSPPPTDSCPLCPLAPVRLLGCELTSQKQTLESGPLTAHPSLASVPHPHHYVHLVAPWSRNRKKLGEHLECRRCSAGLTVLSSDTAGQGRELLRRLVTGLLGLAWQSRG